MSKHIAIFHRNETPIGSIASDIFTFSILIFCIWFSWRMGGGFWTFLTGGMFFICLSAKWQAGPGAKASGWVKLTTKAEAIEWANSLTDDESTAKGGAA